MAKKFYAECTDTDGEEITLELDFSENVKLADLKASLEKEGNIVNKLVTARNHHVCKYCSQIADGTNKDLLCDECYETFGHAYFSEL